MIRGTWADKIDIRAYRSNMESAEEQEVLERTHDARFLSNDSGYLVTTSGTTVCNIINYNLVLHGFWYTSSIYAQF
jgi:hypothetical protein